MMNGRKWMVGSGLLIAGLVTVCVLALTPDPGWLVRMQFSLFTGNGPYQGLGGQIGMSGAKLPPPMPAAQVPNTFTAQLAYAVQDHDIPKPDAPPDDGNRRSRDRNARLSALRSRYDNEPALHATILRFLTMGAVRIARIEGNGVTAKPITQEQIEATRKQRENLRSEDLEAFRMSAQRGTELDPTNAFFWVMLSTYQMAENRDEEALQSLQQAASLTKFDDYCFVEGEGQSQLLMARYGEVGYMGRAAIAASILFPHYAHIRQAARVASVLAVEKEKKGDYEGGMRIRMALAHLGATMRAKSRSYIGSLVGMAITEIATGAPGGELHEYTGTDDEKRTQRHNVWFAYLNRIGHGDDARWFTTEFQKMETAKSWGRRGIDNGVFNIYNMLRVALYWGLGLLLLLAVFANAITGGGVVLLLRLPFFREAQRLPAGVRAAFTVLAVECGLLLFAASSGAFGEKTDGTGPLTIIGTLGIMLMVLLLPLVIFAARRDQETRLHLRQMKHYGLTLTAIGSVIGIIGMSVAFWSRGFSVVTSFVTLWQNLSSDGDSATLHVPNDLITLLTIAVTAVLLPLFWLVGVAIVAKVRRQPVLTACLRGYRAAVLPLVALYLFGYTATVTRTSLVEAKMRQELTSMMENECQYIAKTLGEKWPD